MNDDRLRTYRDKRDFAVTSEPSGAAPPPSDGNRFVVQRHRASRLHYDLRLEAGGVLVSWAVPKGPTLDADVRRMAVHVEDHPLDYFDFEGVIPAGEYGGGDVIVWDWGTWDLVKGDDAIAAVERGDVHFELHGDKLAGRFALVRRGRARDREWLLLKKHDDAARPGWDPEDHLRSVKSGRTNDEVAAAPSASWSGTATWAPATPDELAALDAVHGSGEWSLGEHAVRLGDVDDVLFPAADDPAVTRRDVVRHMATAAPVILPYLADRPVLAHRFPRGITERGSWQRTAPARTPRWIERWHDPATGTDRLLADSPAALAWLAGRSAVELATWSATTRAPDRHAWAVMSITPTRDGTFDDVLVVSRLHRTALEHLDLLARPVVDGVDGVDVWIPVRPTSAAAVGRWLGSLAEAIAGTLPDVVGDRVRLATRPGTTDAPLLVPFSLRPVPGAPAAMPLDWDELDDPELSADRWRIGDVPGRIERHGDPLAPLIGLDQRLPRL